MVRRVERGLKEGNCEGREEEGEKRKQMTDVDADVDKKEP